MSFIEARKISYEYREYDDEEREIGTVKAVNDVSFTIDEGSFVVILGHNGSGKSTLAKQLNALLLPTEGTVFVSGRDTKDPAETLNIRREVGMIFQNPDNQIVAAVVEEDVAFGPENMGVPNPELQRRVSDAIGRVGMLDYLDSPPEHLSGGQKQRIAIAGLLAMKPKCIVMDEPTAMLDPVGRKEVLGTVHELNRSEGITVVLITHNMEEAVDADRILVMDRGRFVMDGTPREIFSRVDELEELRLTVPEVTELANELKKEGVPLPGGILTAGELVEALGSEEGFGR